MSARSARVLRSLNVRAGEGPLAGGVAAVFGVLEIARGFGEVGVDTMILGRFGPSGLPGVLPFLFMALGSVGLVIALAYGAALGRVRRERLFVGILVGAGLLLVGLRIALAVGDITVSAILWLAVYATGLLVMTLYWTLAGAAFDARQAKRLFPLLTGAAIVGSFVGTLGAGPMAALLGVENLVVLEAGLLAGAALLIGRIPVRRPAVAARPARPTSMVRHVRVGFDFVRGSPLMSLVAAAYVLLSILMFSVSYPFLLATSSAFDDDVVVATVLGALSAAITATSLLVSIVIAPRIYARFGVTAGALLLPLVYVAGFGLWLIHFSFATAALVRFSQQVTQRGISNAAWSSLYNTVPADRRGQVLAFIDGVPGQIGTILSGILLLAAGRILAPDQVLWLGVGTAVAATGVVLAIRRRYASSLLAALRSGVAEQVLEGGPGVGVLLRDPLVERALLEAVTAPEPGVREMATTLLARLPSPAAQAALVAATRDVDARVRASAVRALTALRTDASMVDADRLDLDADPAVRAATMILRAGRGEPVAFDLVADASPEIRAAAIAILPDGERREAALIAALDDGSLLVREAVVAALAETAAAADAKSMS
ncbi:MAG: HEAT repeat domain-containing protein [Chloroflexi bacterium]|nr:HEAT repeat domain-containing protein [Chloroflexota bacterium]